MNVFVILNCLKGVYIVKYSNDLMKKYLQTLLHITMRLRVEICLYIITFVSQMGLTALPYFSDPVVEGIASVIGQATLDECTLLIYSSNMDHFHLLRTHPIPRVLLYVRSTHLNKSKLKFPLPFRRAPPCSFNMWYEPSPYARDHFWSRWGDNFLERIPGGIFQSYHLILTSIPGSDYFSTNVPLVVKQMHHCLLLNARCSNSYDLYTPGVWYNESFHVLSYPVPKPRSECLHSDRERSLFFSKWQNYGRYGPLVVATTPDNQQSHVVAYLKTKKVTNYVVVNTVFSTQYLNTTPVMLPLPNGIYGTKDKKTGKWLGMVGELVSGRAHFTSVVGLDYDRSEVIRYTTTVAFDRVNFITPHPRVRHIAGSISFLIFPFTAFVWGATLASFGILWLSLFLDYVIKVNRGQKELQWGPVIYFCAQLLLRPIFDQPSSALSSVMNVSKVKTRSRALYIVWLLVLIVLTSSYKSKMIAVLLKPNQRVPPSTFEELAQSKFTIGAILFNESIFGESFRKLENPISKAILKRIQGYKYMKPDCVVPIKDLDHVCMGYATYLQFNADIYLSDKNGRRLYKNSKESMFPIAAASIVSRRFPHLMDPLNQVVGRLFSTGVLEYNLYKQKEALSLKGRRLAAKSEKLGGKSQQIVDNRGAILHLMFILLMGYVASIIFFGIELIVRLQRRGRKK